ncbi:hypothetical protein R6Q57_011797 [Mikania cordata]
MDYEWHMSSSLPSLNGLDWPHASKDYLSQYHVLLVVPKVVLGDVVTICSVEKFSRLNALRTSKAYVAGHFSGRCNGGEVDAAFWMNLHVETCVEKEEKEAGHMNLDEMVMWKKDNTCENNVLELKR